MSKGKFKMADVAYCHLNNYISSYFVLHVGVATGKYSWSMFENTAFYQILNVVSSMNSLKTHCAGDHLQPQETS